MLDRSYFPSEALRQLQAMADAKNLNLSIYLEGDRYCASYRGVKVLSVSTMSHAEKWIKARKA